MATILGGGPRSTRTWLLPAIVALSTAAAGQTAPTSAGPRELLATAPFDRVTLADGTALEVEPVSPRPLPPYDASKDKEKDKEPEPAKDGKKPPPPREGNVLLPAQVAKKEAEQAERTLNNELTLHWLGADGGGYKVRRSNVKSVEYYEDMLLAEGERFQRQGDYARAFEHYLAVRRRSPGWRGLAERVDALLYEEGSSALRLEDDRDRGLRLLGELAARRPDYPGLAASLAEGYGGRILDLFTRGNFREARKVLRELAAVAPAHPVVGRSRERFEARARGLVDRALAAEGTARLDLLAEAAGVWPSLEGLRPRYEEAFRATPTLDVAVIDHPRPVGPAPRSPAESRVADLLYVPLLADAGEDAAEGKPAGQLAAKLVVGDLGRRLVIDLREFAAWSDGPRKVGAADVARTLADRADPRSTRYRARWSVLVDRIETPDDRRVEVRLNRPALRASSWLLGPIAPAQAGDDGRVAAADGSRRLVGDGPYRVEGGTDPAADFRATGSAKVARIREHRVVDPSAAIAALIRGDVSLVERVSPDRVALLSRIEGLKVGTYAQPSLHRIAVDGRTAALRNRTLRRGLSAAIDRLGLLEKVVLKRPIDGANTPSDGPFPIGSYADAPEVRPLDYDPLLARMLVAAARRELGGAPLKLTFAYPSTPEALAVGPALAEAWRVAGVEVTAVERPESELESMLRAGDRFDLAYRAGMCADPALDAGPLLCPGVDAEPSADGLGAVASPRTLQLLLQLERAAEWPSARALAIDLDRETRDELAVLPLWQLRDHYAYRDVLKGPVGAIGSLYAGVASWEVGPWYPAESP